MCLRTQRVWLQTWTDKGCKGGCGGGHGSRSKDAGALSAGPAPHACSPCTTGHPMHAPHARGLRSTCHVCGLTRPSLTSNLL